MRERLKLAADEELRLEASRSKGFMSETDVTDYSIIDGAGNVVGTIEFTEHTAVKGLRVTNTVVQKDADGQVVVRESWRP